MATFADLIFIKLITGPDTPAGQAARAGTTLGVDPTMVQPVPVDGTTKVRFYDMWGVFQSNAGTIEFVIGDRVASGLKTSINNIPGTPWVSADARLVYVQTAKLLLDQGFSEQTIVNRLTALYGAAQTELTARRP